MVVEDVFVIRGRGVVATGRVDTGTLRVGDVVTVNGSLEFVVDGIEAFRKKLSAATAGETVGLRFSGAEREQLNRGDVLTAPSIY